MKQKKVIIMGAGGRDFFIFQRYFFRNFKSSCRIVAFTAAQIPGIDNRVYPGRLAGSGYFDGIPIYSESELIRLIIESKNDGSDVDVYFAYSDVSLDHIDKVRQVVNYYGAHFVFEKKIYTECMISSRKPVIAVTAIRTGCGKSAVSRYIAKFLKNKGLNVVLVRHPMPYFNLQNSKNDVQRFASHKDIDYYKCTFEEREEYEPIIDAGLVVYAGVDYGAILRVAELEADVIIWDGGNNDLPFYKPDLWITVMDSYRADDIIGAKYPHGYWNLKNADIVLINKSDTASEERVDNAWNLSECLNGDATVFKTGMGVKMPKEAADFIKGKSVIAVEDGPTVTHGGMSFGAATLAAEKYGAELADPRCYLDNRVREVFVKYQHLWRTKILPCVGYSGEEIVAMEKTINVIPADAVLVGTPIDLDKILKINKPILRVFYDIHFMTGKDGDDFGEVQFRAKICATLRALKA